MESPKPRVKAFKEQNDLNNLTLGPSLGDSITKVWPEIEGLSHIFAVTPFILVYICSAELKQWHFIRPRTLVCGVTFKHRKLMTFDEITVCRTDGFD